MKKFRISLYLIHALIPLILSLIPESLDIETVESEYGSLVELKCPEGDGTPFMYTQERSSLHLLHDSVYTITASESTSGWYECGLLSNLTKTLTKKKYELISYRVINRTESEYLVNHLENIIIRPIFDQTQFPLPEVQWIFGTDHNSQNRKNNVFVSYTEVKITNFSCRNSGGYILLHKPTQITIFQIKILLRDLIPYELPNSRIMTIANRSTHIEIGTRWFYPVQISLINHNVTWKSLSTTEHDARIFVIPPGKYDDDILNVEVGCYLQANDSQTSSHSVFYNFSVTSCQEFVYPNSNVSLFSNSTCLALTGTLENGSWRIPDGLMYPQFMNQTVLINVSSLRQSIDISYSTKDLFQTFHLVYNEQPSEQFNLQTKTTETPVSTVEFAIETFSFVLHCPLNNETNENSSFNWKLNSTHLTTTNTNTLKIENVSESDGGLYTCYRTEFPETVCEVNVVIFKPIFSGETVQINPGALIALVPSDLIGYWRFPRSQFYPTLERATVRNSILWIRNFQCMYEGTYDYITYSDITETFVLQLAGLLSRRTTKRYFAKIGDTVSLSIPTSRVEGVRVFLIETPTNKSELREFHSNSSNFEIQDVQPSHTGNYTFGIECHTDNMLSETILRDELHVCEFILPDEVFNIATLSGCLILYNELESPCCGNWLTPLKTTEVEIHGNALVITNPNPSNVGTYEYSFNGKSYQYRLIHVITEEVRTYVGDVVHLNCGHFESKNLSEIYWRSYPGGQILAQASPQLTWTVNDVQTQLECYSGSILQSSYKLKLFALHKPVNGTEIICKGYESFVIDNDDRLFKSNGNYTLQWLVNDFVLDDISLLRHPKMNVFQNGPRLYIENCTCQNNGKYKLFQYNLDGVIVGSFITMVSVDIPFGADTTKKFFTYSGSLYPENVTVSILTPYPFYILFFDQNDNFVSGMVGNYHTHEFILPDESRIMKYEIQCLDPTVGTVEQIFRDKKMINHTDCERADYYYKSRGNIRYDECIIFSPISPNSRWILPHNLKLDHDAFILEGAHLAIRSISHEEEYIFYNIALMLMQTINIVKKGFFFYTYPVQISPESTDTIVQVTFGSVVFLSCNLFDLEKRNLNITSEDIKYTWIINETVLEHQNHSYFPLNIHENDNHVITCQISHNDIRMFTLRSYLIELHQRVSMENLTPGFTLKACRHCNYVLDAQNTDVCRSYLFKLGHRNRYRNYAVEPIWSFNSENINRDNLVEYSLIHPTDPCRLWLTSVSCDHDGMFSISKNMQYSTNDSLPSSVELYISLTKFDEKKTTLGNFKYINGQGFTAKILPLCREVLNISLIGEKWNSTITHSTDEYINFTLDPEIIAENDGLFKFRIERYHKSFFNPPIDFPYEKIYDKSMIHSRYEDLNLHIYHPVYASPNSSISVTDFVHGLNALILVPHANTSGIPLNSSQCYWKHPIWISKSKIDISQPFTMFMNLTTLRSMNDLQGAYWVECKSGESYHLDIVKSGQISSKTSSESINYTKIQKKCIRNYHCNLQCSLSMRSELEMKPIRVCWVSDVVHEHPLNMGSTISLQINGTKDRNYKCYSCDEPTNVFSLIEVTVYEGLIVSGNASIFVQPNEKYALKWADTNSDIPIMDDEGNVSPQSIFYWTLPSHRSSPVSPNEILILQWPKQYTVDDVDVDNEEKVLYFNNFRCFHQSEYLLTILDAVNHTETYGIKLQFEIFFSPNLENIPVRVLTEEIYTLNLSVNWNYNVSLKLYRENELLTSSESNRLIYNLNFTGDSSSNSLELRAWCDQPITDVDSYLPENRVMYISVNSYTLLEIYWNVAEEVVVNPRYLSLNDDSPLNIALICMPLVEISSHQIAWWYMSDSSLKSFELAEPLLVNNETIFVDNHTLYLTNFNDKLQGLYRCGDPLEPSSHVGVHLISPNLDVRDSSQSELTNISRTMNTTPIVDAHDQAFPLKMIISQMNTQNSTPPLQTQKANISSNLSVDYQRYFVDSGEKLMINCSVTGRNLKSVKLEKIMKIDGGYEHLPVIQNVSITKKVHHHHDSEPKDEFTVTLQLDYVSKIMTVQDHGYYVCEANDGLEQTVSKLFEVVVVHKRSNISQELTSDSPLQSSSSVIFYSVPERRKYEVYSTENVSVIFVAEGPGILFLSIFDASTNPPTILPVDHHFNNPKQVSANLQINPTEFKHNLTVIRGVLYSDPQGGCDASVQIIDKMGICETTIEVFVFRNNTT